MRNMAFSITTQQMYAETKDITRRIGWTFLKPGDIVMAVEKGMGLKRGEKVKKIYPIEIVSVRGERLSSITIEDVKREGFPKMTVHQFVRMFAASHKCDVHAVVNRIEFRRWVPTSCCLSYLLDGKHGPECPTLSKKESE